MKFVTERTKKLVIAVLLLIIAVSSVTVFSKKAANPESYKATIQSIDDKKATVMSVTAGAAATSTLLALVPGDATTPIANQIMRISSYLMIVVCALVLEKSLLTVMGYLSFRILIPVACVLLGIHMFYKKEMLKNLAVKFIVFAIAVTAIIPFSIKIGDMICETNSIVIEQVTEETIQSDDENDTWLNNLGDAITNGISGAGEFAKQKLNRFMDAVAVFIVAYCVIPVVVIIAMVWFVKILFGINIPLKKSA